WRSRGSRPDRAFPATACCGWSWTRWSIRPRSTSQPTRAGRRCASSLDGWRSGAGEVHLEGGPLRGGRGDRHPPMVGGHELLDDVEAEPDAAALAVDPRAAAQEGPEELPQRLLRDRRAAVVDAQGPLALAPFGAAAHLGAFRAVAERVAEQVADHLKDAVAVPDARRVAADLEREEAVGMPRLHLLDTGSCQPREVRGSRKEREPAAEPHLSKVEQVPDQARGAVEAVDDAADDPDLDQGEIAPPLQHLRAQHRGLERASQIAAAHPGVLVLEFAPLAEVHIGALALGDVEDGADEAHRLAGGVERAPARV